MLSPKLSICIATYNRGRFIGETLDSILGQLQPNVELVIVDGASPDNTPEVVGQYLLLHPQVRYHRERENSGVDRDYDKAVEYAQGEYCWLMTDDDLLVPGAITRVLAALNSNCNLLVVNTELRSFDLSRLIVARRLCVTDDRGYKGGRDPEFFISTANHLGFIGAVIIRRNVWRVRDRQSYYDTLYVHVGVIFQHPPVDNIRIIAEPLVMVRHYNAMWAPRTFEIQMFNWPKLIWSFIDFSDSSKSEVCAREPWRRYRALLYNRAAGSYSVAAYRKHLSGRMGGIWQVFAYAIALVPARLANVLAILYYALINRSSQQPLSDLLHGDTATAAGRRLGRILGADRELLRQASRKNRQ